MTTYVLSLFGINIPCTVLTIISSIAIAAVCFTMLVLPADDNVIDKYIEFDNRIANIGLGIVISVAAGFLTLFLFSFGLN